MKTILFAFVVLQLCCRGVLFSQTPQKASDYFNAIQGLWEKAQYTTAIDYSVKLRELSPPSFEDLIHDVLSQCIISQNQREHASTFLKLLYQSNNKDVHQVIAPIHALNAIIETNNKDSISFLVNTMLSLLSDTSNYSSKAERYGLVAVKQMEAKGIHDIALTKRLINKVIHNVESHRYIDSASVKGRDAEARRGWNRYLLSYCHYLLYRLDPDGVNAEDHLKLAVKYAPDSIDRQASFSYYYDAGLLAGNADEVDVEWLYVDYLMRNNRKKDALSVVTKKAVTEATNTNCSKLQALYQEVGYHQPFAEYWVEAINSASKVAPSISVKFMDDKTVQFGKPSGMWSYIDVWGTWCSPCRKELPELEKVYQDNVRKGGTRLLVYSFSYRSTNITDFMKTNKYSFPVAEVDSSVVRAFDVDGYPTKILITPQGRFLRIPFGVNWQEYLKNYCMLTTAAIR